MLVMYAHALFFFFFVFLFRCSSSKGMDANGTSKQLSIEQKLALVNEKTWLKLGDVAEMMQEYPKALECFQLAEKSAEKANLHSIEAWKKIASLCRGREQFQMAVEYFNRVLKCQENDGETWAALGHCYLMMDSLKETYEAYQQALYHLSNPRDPKLWYGIGILYDRYGSLTHAEEAFSAVMKMDPKFEKASEIYFRLGIIYKQQEKYDLSLQCFQYILDSPPRPLTQSDIWFQTGHVYEQSKKYESAKEAYEYLLQETPDHAKVLQQLGWLYHQPDTGFTNQGSAIQHLTLSLKSDGNDAQSWYLLGRCYMAEQNYNKAYEAYQQAVYRDARNPTFWCSIGVLYYQINQYRDALDAYSRAIRLNPNISEVWYDLGTLYESCNNQINDALDAYQKAADLDPTNIHIQKRLDLLRNAESVPMSKANAPEPQDVRIPNQYASTPAEDDHYLQSAPPGPPGPPPGRSDRHHIAGGATHPGDEGVSTPQLPMHTSQYHDGAGPGRGLPMPRGPPAGRRSPGPYSQYPPQEHHENVHIPGIGGPAPTPVYHEDGGRTHPASQPPIRQHYPPQQGNFPPSMSMRQSPYTKQENARSPVSALHAESGHGHGGLPPSSSASRPSSRGHKQHEHHTHHSNSPRYQEQVSPRHAGMQSPHSGGRGEYSSKTHPTAPVKREDDKYRSMSTSGFTEMPGLEHSRPDQRHHSQYPPHAQPYPPHQPDQSQYDQRSHEPPRHYEPRHYEPRQQHEQRQYDEERRQHYGHEQRQQEQSREQEQVQREQRQQGQRQHGQHAEPKQHLQKPESKLAEPESLKSKHGEPELSSTKLPDPEESRTRPSEAAEPERRGERVMERLAPIAVQNRTPQSEPKPKTDNETSAKPQPQHQAEDTSKHRSPSDDKKQEENDAPMASSPKKRGDVTMEEEEGQVLKGGQEEDEAEQTEEEEEEEGEIPAEDNKSEDGETTASRNAREVDEDYDETSVEPAQATGTSQKRPHQEEASREELKKSKVSSEASPAEEENTPTRAEDDTKPPSSPADHTAGSA